MFYARCDWTYHLQNGTSGTVNNSGTVTSAIFPQYLSAEGTLRFPTPEELVTQGGADYDSALEYKEFAHDILLGTTGTKSVELSIKNSHSDVISTKNQVKLGNDGTYPYSRSYAIYYTMGQKNMQGLYFRARTASP